MGMGIEQVECQRVPAPRRQIAGEIVVIDEVLAEVDIVAGRQSAGEFKAYPLAGIEPVIGQIQRTAQGDGMVCIPIGVDALEGLVDDRLQVGAALFLRTGDLCRCATPGGLRLSG